MTLSSPAQALVVTIGELHRDVVKWLAVSYTAVYSESVCWLSCLLSRSCVLLLYKFETKEVKHRVQWGLTCVLLMSDLKGRRGLLIIEEMLHVVWDRLRQQLSAQRHNHWCFDSPNRFWLRGSLIIRLEKGDLEATSEKLHLIPYGSVLRTLDVLAAVV